MELLVETHPSLDVAAFVTRFSPNLGAFSGSTALRVERPPGLSAPDDALRSAIRDVLRHRQLLRAAGLTELEKVTLRAVDR